MKKAITIAALFLCAAGSGSTQAQAVYRCGSEYSQKPCPGAAAVDTDDPRTAAQAKAAIDKTQRDAKLAKELEMDRLAQEKRAGGPGKMILGAQPAASAPQPHASRPRQAKKRPAGKESSDVVTAVAPKKPAEKKAKKTSG